LVASVDLVGDIALREETQHWKLDAGTQAIEIVAVVDVVPTALLGDVNNIRII